MRPEWSRSGLFLIFTFGRKHGGKCDGGGFNSQNIFSK
jgi:hypothetical protein